MAQRMPQPDAPTERAAPAAPPSGPVPSGGRRRAVAWAGSAALHGLAAMALLHLLGNRAPEPPTVIMLEMPSPEAPPAAESTTPEEQTMAEAPAAPEPPEAQPAPPEPPPSPEPPPPEPPPMAAAPPEPPPPLAELPPPPDPPPPEPPQPEPPTPDPVAELPPPPPVPPPPTPAPSHPRRPAPAQPRPAVAQALPTAPVTPAAPPGPPAAAPAPPAAVVAPSPNYVAQLFAALERHKVYPSEARFRRAQGVAMLRFRMRRDGTVIGFRIERSAGDQTLDQAVLAMIQSASPLPPPPAELGGETIELTVPVRFALR